MSTKTNNLSPDERPPGPLEPATDPQQHAISGTRWMRFTPVPALRRQAEFDDDREAGKGAALAAKTLAASRTADGKSYEDLFDLDTQIKDGRLTVWLTPKRGHEITETGYDAVRRIEAAWIDAFQKGVLGMKPERTQYGDVIPIVLMEPSLQQDFEARKLSGSEWELVTYYHTVAGEYHFPSSVAATAACETVLGITSGTSAVPTVTVSGKTLYVELRSSRGTYLTEVEFGLVQEIEAALSGQPEPGTA